MARRLGGSGRSVRRGIGLVGAVLVVVVATACPAPLPEQIGPNQAFRGFVNGKTDGAVVQTACGGPVTEGRTGHAVAGQLVAVAKAAKGPGNTGDNGAVFVEANGSAQVVQLSGWEVAAEFPTDVEVPCEGPGLVVFDPCFGFAGCLGAAQAATVKVTYVNIAD